MTTETNPAASPDATLAAWIGNVEAFPILKTWDFFNHAGVAPIPRVCGDAIRTFVRQAEETAYIDTGWYRDVNLLRAEAAALINADTREIAFIKNTSEGIATVANGIQWTAGDRIITTEVEYPANIYPWMDVAQRFGVELVMVPEVTGEDGRRRVPMEHLLREADHPRTKLVALSHVEFASGQRHDIATIGRFCRENGKRFCVDAIQTMGVLPVDVKAMSIDYLAADGHKWLLGPEGAGIFYCRAELLEETHPLVIGWMNVVNAQNFGHYDFKLRPDAAKFECGSWNLAGLLGLRASVGLLRKATIPAIAARVRVLTDHLIAGLQRKGYVILSPRGASEWSSIVSFTAPHGTPALHEQIVRDLRKDHRIEIALREGRLRCAAHFYNTTAQLDRLLAALP